jgi:hypothetical protein
MCQEQTDVGTGYKFLNMGKREGELGVNNFNAFYLSGQEG